MIKLHLITKQFDFSSGGFKASTARLLAQAQALYQRYFRNAEREILVAERVSKGPVTREVRKTIFVPFTKSAAV